MIKSILLLLASVQLCFGQYGSFNDQAFLAQAATSSIPGHTADTLAWKADVIANGGATPTEATLTAMDGFVNSVAGIKSHLKWINLIAPDSLIAAETPLYHTSGSDPSTGSGWSGTLNTSGIKCGTGALFTGCDPSVVFSTANMGLWVYIANSAPGQPAVAFGGGNGSSCAEIWGTSNPNYQLASYSAWNINATSATINNGDYVFFGASRTSTSLVTYYIANGNNAWASHGTSASASGSAPAGSGNNSIGMNSAGICAGISASAATVSFMGVTDGLVTADGQTLYNAVQTFRTTIGGGKT